MLHGQTGKQPVCQVQQVERPQAYSCGATQCKEECSGDTVGAMSSHADDGDQTGEQTWAGKEELTGG